MVVGTASCPPIFNPDLIDFSLDDVAGVLFLASFRSVVYMVANSPISIFVTEYVFTFDPKFDAGRLSQLRQD